MLESEIQGLTLLLDGEPVRYPAHVIRGFESIPVLIN
jgi:hypothetical protein